MRLLFWWLNTRIFKEQTQPFYERSQPFFDASAFVLVYHTIGRC